MTREECVLSMWDHGCLLQVCRIRVSVSGDVGLALVGRRVGTLGVETVRRPVCRGKTGVEVRSKVVGGPTLQE